MTRIFFIKVSDSWNIASGFPGSESRGGSSSTSDILTKLVERIGGGLSPHSNVIFNERIQKFYTLFQLFYTRLE